MMTEREIRKWLKKVEADSRIHMKSANVVSNAPLVQEQMGLETTSDGLRRILCLPLCGHNPKTRRWEVKEKAAGQA